MKLAIMYKLKILPENIQIEVKEDTDLLTAIIKAGISIRSTCGGHGTCGTCKVKIKKGSYSTRPTHWITEEEKKNGYVLACQTQIKSDLEIEIPHETRIQKIQAVGEEISSFRETTLEFPEEKKYLFSPIAKKIFLKLPKPNLEDNIPDFERIKREITKNLKEEEIKIEMPILRSLCHFIRQVNWELTVSIVELNNEIEIIQLEPGNTSGEIYGIALDIGTTTVVIYLVDLNTGSVLSAKATYNKQISFGDDIISRIIYSEEKGIKKLNQAVCDTVNTIIDSIVKENKISKDKILAIQAAGNTTMTHLFLGIPPEFIRKEPYIPVTNFPQTVKASELGININPRGIISCLPGVASYIGGDITAGVLASGIEDSSEVSLLVDLGTNGEIVLGNKDWLISASCSAGPAFEGVGIKCGIRATDGAIQRIKIENGKIEYSTISDKKPKGICGSGLIDIPAEFLKNGIINRAGKFNLNEKNLKLYYDRMRKNEDDEYEFVIVKKEETETEKDIVITESDISNLIRSKGAIFLGIYVLLQEMDIRFEDVKKIYISGGLGTYLDIEKAIFIGLLPDLPCERFNFIGNSSIKGAKMCLLSREARLKSKEIAKKMTYIDLSLNPKFMNEYTSTLFLPHTNIDLFPSVKKFYESNCAPLAR
ncbi:MAG: ASKHA domain-containing protein [Endomicrobiia bacterium]